MVLLVGHREPKGAATEMPHLSPPRQSSTLPVAATDPRSPNGWSPSFADAQPDFSRTAHGRTETVAASVQCADGHSLHPLRWWRPEDYLERPR